MKTEDIENQDEQKWKSVNQLLSRAGSRLNILEEEIDVEVQHQYMDLLEHLIKSGDFKTLREDAIIHAQDLFDEAVDDERTMHDSRLFYVSFSCRCLGWGLVGRKGASI